MTRPAARALLVAAFAVAAGAAAAQAPQPAPSDAAACLYQGAQKLQYPPDKLADREGGVVVVELTFAALDAAPSTRFPDETGVDRRLVAAVGDHVRQYRVPCMAPGAPPVTLRQTFVFTPNDGRKVAESLPLDADEAARRQQMHCLTHLAGLQRPEFPYASLRQSEQGVVLLGMTFSTPDAAPTATVLNPSVPLRLQAAVLQFAAGWRLPCLTTPPLRALKTFKFQIVNDQRTTLPDLTLKQFIGGASELPRGVFFDLGALGCPFDLRVTYLRPYARNDVREIEQSMPERRPLLDWLSQISLRLRHADNEAILGQTFDLSVPCGRIEL